MPSGYDYGKLQKWVNATQMSGSADTFRTAIGGSRTIQERADFTTDGWIGDSEMLAPEFEPPDDVDVLPAYSVHWETHTERGSFMWHVVANNTRQINRGTNLLVPSYQMPVRATGVPDEGDPTALGEGKILVKDDNHWKTLFLGGSFGEENYDAIYNELIFSDHSHTRYYPYTEAETHSWPTKTATNVVSIKPVYRASLARYQNYTNTISERLIPSIYPLLLYSSEGSDFNWSTGDVTEQEVIQQRMEKWMFNFISMDEAIGNAEVMSVVESAARPMDGAAEPSPAPLLTIAPTDPEYPTLVEEETDPLINMYTYLNETVPWNPITSSTAQEVNERHKNIYFGIKTNDLTGHDAFNLLPSYKFPYYIQFNIPKIQAGYFEQSIEYNDFDVKFLNTLKEIFTNQIEELQPKSRNFVVDEKSDIWIPTGHNKAEHFSQNQITERQPREIDYLKMLSYAYNNYFSVPSPGEYPDSCFWGPRGNSEKAVHDTTGQYRYMNTSNSLGVINDVLDYVADSSYFDLGDGGAFTSRLYNTQNQVFRDAYTDGALDITQQVWNGAMSTIKDVGDYATHAELVEQVGDQYSECLAYRIEKREQNSGEVIQNFWFLNSPWLGNEMGTGPDSMHFSGGPDVPTDLHTTFDFADTQVIYGKQYSYTVYAYMLVTGTKWKFSDLRLSRVIATLDDDSDGVPDRYCLEFYDPNTDRAVPTIFQTRDELLDNNEYATDAQLTHDHKFLAEWYINYEPSIKLFEIPIAEKTIAVQDHPPNKLNVSPFQKIDNSQTIGFHLSYERYVDNLRYPTPIDATDRQYKSAYYESHDLMEVDPVLEQVTRVSAQEAQYIDVFRTTVRPTKISDFDGHFLDQINLKIPDTEYNYSSAYFYDTINTNRKYYYLFRATNDNGAAGHLSEIYEAELVNDGGYIYSLFETIFEEDLEEKVFTETMKGMKKIAQLQPNLSHLALNTEDVDFGQTAESQLENVKVGTTVGDSIWDKTFKVRLTSKKTGRKLDFNITYKLERE